jgi:hypothetical protein
MVKGIIQDFYTTKEGAEKSAIKFLVKVEPEVSENACTVCAELPNDALKYDMIKAGAHISWELKKVYIEIEGVEDIPFKKVGNSSEDTISFYEQLITIKNVEKKGSKGK